MTLYDPDITYDADILYDAEAAGGGGGGGGGGEIIPHSFCDLKARVRSVVRDTTGDFITEDDLGAWINESIADLATRLRICQTEVSGVTPAGNQLALPPDSATQPDVYDVLSLRLGTDDVEFVADDVWDSWADSGGDSPPQTLGRIFADKLELYPTPKTGTAYKLRYTFIPAELVACSDLHVLPHYLEVRIVAWPKMQAMLKLNDYFNAQMYEQTYEVGLPPRASGRATFQPGPLNVMNTPGPFDTIDAAHN